MHDVKPALGERGGATGRGTSLKGGGEGPPAGKKTKGRVKIKMEFIDNKLRRYTTFSKRKTGIMKKVSELKFPIFSKFEIFWAKNGQIWTKNAQIWTKSGQIWAKNGQIWTENRQIWTKKGQISKS